MSGLYLYKPCKAFWYISVTVGPQNGGRCAEGKIRCWGLRFHISPMSILAGFVFLFAAPNMRLGLVSPDKAFHAKDLGI